MSGENSKVNYLNPLTLEAQMFLNTLDTLGRKYNQVDINLCKVLSNVMLAIEKFFNQKLETIIATDKTNLVDVNDLKSLNRSFVCTVCHKHVGNTADKAAAHFANGHPKTEREARSERRKNKKTENKTVPPLKLPKKARALISNDMEQFFMENIQIGEKLKQIPEYDTIEKQLLLLVSPLFPEQVVKIYKFGSRLTGIGSRNSDLDLFVDIGNSFNTFENRASPQTLSYLQKVRNALQKQKESWKLVVAIENARVPIIKVSNIATGIECDIGFSNSLGFCNTKLIIYLFDLQPIARCMCIFLKKWLDRAKLNEHISTYSSALMVIYFLQSKKLLPSIERIQFDCEPKVEVGPWIANFVQKPLVDLRMQKINVNANECKNYLAAFFQFYANFKFHTYVVCPYFGILNMEIRLLEKAMPKRYIAYCKASKDVGLQLNKSMVVQDPIQLNHNVTKAVSQFTLKSFSDYCRQSATSFVELK